MPPFLLIQVYCQELATAPQGESRDHACMIMTEPPAKRLIPGYCQELTNPIPMENLILVGRKLLGRIGKSIGFSL